MIQSAGEQLKASAALAVEALKAPGLPIPEGAYLWLDCVSTFLARRQDARRSTLATGGEAIRDINRASAELCHWLIDASSAEVEELVGDARARRSRMRGALRS